MDYSKAAKCALLSQEIYQDFTPQLRFSEFANATPELIDPASTDTDTQCAIVSDAAGTAIYIVFRGSEKRLDWDTNVNFKQVQMEFQQEIVQEEIVQEQEQIYPYQEESRSGAKMHRGFVDAYLSVREQIHNYFKSHAALSVTVTGHSLGGALATLCAVDIQYNFSNFKIDIYTFGSPRVGNSGFRESFNRRVPDSYRFVYGMDVVPALPRPWQGYRHVEQEHRLGDRFNLRFVSQRFEDHQISNYISALTIVAKQESTPVG